jgi:hypothetical protein
MGMNNIDVYSMVLAFLLGFAFSNWNAGILHSLGRFLSWLPFHTLRDVDLWVPCSTPSIPQISQHCMVDQAVQTQYDMSSELPNEETGLVAQGTKPIMEISKIPNVDVQELEDNQDGYQAIELDDLDDLEGQIYDSGYKAVLPLPAVQIISEDRVLTSMVSTLLKLFGDPVPYTCTPGSTSTRKTDLGEDSFEGFDRFRPPMHAYTNGDFTTSSAQKDRLEMEGRLEYLICRYATENGQTSLLSQYIERIPRTEYFGLFKLAIDRDHTSVFESLVFNSHKDIDPAVLEYAAFCGRLEMMRVLYDIGIGANGTKTTHPLSAAVAGGSTAAVKLLLEWGAELNTKNRKSIVKEYTQTPMVIAAHHRNVVMIKYLISMGAPPRGN